MEETIRLLAPRLSQVKIIIDKLGSYLELINDFVKGINPNEYNKINVTRNDLAELINSIQHSELNETNILCCANELYTKLNMIDTALGDIFKLFDNPTYAKLAVYNMSSTYSSNVQLIRNSANLAREKYINESLKSDEIIINGLLERVSVGTSLAFLVKENPINKFTIKLLHWVINNSSGEQRRRAELIVEKQKDILLNSTRVKGNYSGVQCMLSRYNLLPNSLSMKIQDLFNELGLIYDGDKSLDDNCTTAAASGAGIILLNISTPNPMEFNLAGLIDSEYIDKNDLKTKPTAGLNKKILRKYNTANMLSDGNWGVPLRKFEGNGEWFILQSLNGELWRVMALHENRKIPTADIAGLVNGISTRPDRYNSIQSEKILSKIIDPKSHITLQEYEEFKVSAPNSEPIKTKIIEKLTKKFESTDIKSVSGFRKSIDPDYVSEVISDVLIHTIGTKGKGAAEYLLTYMIKMEAIIRFFTKKLEQSVGSASISERMFKEYSGDELKSRLVDIFRKSVSDVVEELDQSRTWTDYDMTLKEFFLDRRHIIV